MKGCKSVVIAVLTALTLLSLAPLAGADEGGVHWVTYEKGLEEQGSSKKPMLIFFHLPYCYRCKEMKRKVYSDPGVIKYINDHFIPVIVDMDTEKQRAQSFEIDYVPTHVFVAPDGSIALREKDVISKSRFEQMLRYVADQKYKTMDFKTYEKSQS